MSTNNNLSELEALRNDYNALRAKVESQEIINDQLIRNAQHNVLDKISLWYRRRVAILPIVAVLSGVFGTLGFNKGYIALILFCGVAQFILDRVCHRILGMKDLMEQDMTTAANRILSHRRARRISEAVMIIPFTAMLVWTLYLSTDGIWEPNAYILTIVALVIAFDRAVRIAKQNRKDLDEFIKSRGMEK
ncbi:MAG: hypothetical protein MJZ16_02515 [Bacteroidales bacterium]|nr:hypothetical protein [Bacteroidales bacterium]